MWFGSGRSDDMVVLAQRVLISSGFRPFVLYRWMWIGDSLWYSAISIPGMSIVIAMGL
jgi:hypothetical protein